MIMKMIVFQKCNDDHVNDNIEFIIMTICNDDFDDNIYDSI